MSGGDGGEHWIVGVGYGVSWLDGLGELEEGGGGEMGGGGGNIPFTGILPLLNLRSLTLNTPA